MPTNVVHWLHGSETKLKNMLLICPNHHRLLHEGGVRLVSRQDGSLVFVRPDGRVLNAPSRAPVRQGAAALVAGRRDAGVRIDAETNRLAHYEPRPDYAWIAGVV